MQTTITAAELAQAACEAWNEENKAAVDADDAEFHAKPAHQVACLKAILEAHRRASDAASEALIDFKAQTLGDVHAKLAFLGECTAASSYDDYCKRLVKSACADLRRLCGSGA